MPVTDLVPMQPTRVPVRAMAVATAVCAALALALSFVGGVGHSGSGPAAVVVAQALWNAAQAGGVLLALALWATWHRPADVALGGALVVALPFSIYVTGPGAWGCAVLLLGICLRARTAPDLALRMVDAPARGTPLVVKFATLAFVCNLGSSLYNFTSARDYFPHWERFFIKASAMAGFDADLETIAHFLYTLGIDSVQLPAYIEPGLPIANGFGVLVFICIWTVLPALYILYFAALAKSAKDTPGAWLQRALCLWAIIHFLFLTDIVDYRFGRGILNPYGELAHWSERIVWRYAIIIPVWQKLATGGWRKGNGWPGVALHYVAALWVAGFVTYQIILFDIPNIRHLLFGGDFTPYRLFGHFPRVFRYYGVLNLMLIAYGSTMLFFRCKRFVTCSVKGSQLQS